MNTEVKQEIRAAAHAALTMSRLAVDYQKQAEEFPWNRTKLIAESERCWGEGYQWLDHARDLRERYA